MFSPFVGLMILFFTALCKYFKISKTKILITLCHFYIDIVCMVQHRVTQDWPCKGEKKSNIKVIYDMQSGGSKAFSANFSMWIQLVWIFRGGGGCLDPLIPPPIHAWAQCNIMLFVLWGYHSLSITFDRVSQLHGCS